MVHIKPSLFDAILTVLGHVGYHGDIVEKGYRYPDRFANGQPERQIDAALFARTPVSYETALFGIVTANGARGAALANEHRSLGAPIILEVQGDTVNIWAVGRDEASTQLQTQLDEPGFREWVSTDKEKLRPLEFLRAKEFKGGPTFYQPGLFAGLIPELEAEISKSLDPILRGAFKAGIRAYQQIAGVQPPEPKLFKLGFWLLTGKVFADRGHKDFADLNALSDPDTVLKRVAEHYGETAIGLLNREAREAIFGRIWKSVDFRNLSVEVLSQIWSRTLVTAKTRKQLGIHRTRKSIVRYIVDRIPFEDFAAEERHILEPCSGSATFLVAALGRMRGIPPVMTDPIDRHAYFQSMLTGFERDAFGVEIGRLCLALADYPNPNGWDIKGDNIFNSGEFKESLQVSRIVLCNPPFKDFDDDEFRAVGAKSKHRPAELLARVLESLHPEGVLGFVLPRSFIDSGGYASVRREIAERFSSIELLSLPAKGWDYADKETVLLIATRPGSHAKTIVSFGEVREQSWRDFEWFHTVHFRESEEKSPGEAATSLAVLEFKDVWEHLTSCSKLRDLASVNKGVEWTLNQKENRDLFVRSDPDEASVFQRGIPPRAYPFFAYERPPVAYLNFQPEYQRRPKSFARPWHLPKVILSRLRKSRLGPWKLAAFADFEGLACFETFIGVWPNDKGLIIPLTAVLNGPIANAFAAVRETGPHIVVDTVRNIPIPVFTNRQRKELDRLVTEYLEAVGSSQGTLWSTDQAKNLLRRIDAFVLEAYDLPPRLERAVLDFFRGHKRNAVPFEFGDYFPEDFESFVPLSVYVSEEYQRATGEDFLRNVPQITDPELSDVLADLE